MIPYFEFHSVSIGPLTLYAWGALVAAGTLAAVAAGARLGAMRGLDPKKIWDLAFWSVLGGFVGARLVHVLGYNPTEYLADPALILKVWDGGWSSVGGLLGGTITGILYARTHKLDPWKHADLAGYALPLGFGIGRIGCFLIHDHPGTATDFFLGVRYPDGVVRHDHGLYLALDGLIVFSIFLFLAKRKVREGTFLIAFLMWEGAFRFCLDFLRINDATYLGLTPAQYVSALMFAFGCFLLVRQKLQAKN